MPVSTRPKRNVNALQGKIDFPCRKTRSSTQHLKESWVATDVPANTQNTEERHRSRSVGPRTSRSLCQRVTPQTFHTPQHTRKSVVRNQKIPTAKICYTDSDSDDNWLDDILAPLMSPKKRQHNKDNVDENTLGSSPKKITKAVDSIDESRNANKMPRINIQKYTDSSGCESEKLDIVAESDSLSHSSSGCRRKSKRNEVVQCNTRKSPRKLGQIVIETQKRDSLRDVDEKVNEETDEKINEETDEEINEETDEETDEEINEETDEETDEEIDEKTKKSLSRVTFQLQIDTSVSTELKKYTVRRSPRKSHRKFSVENCTNYGPIKSPHRHVLNEDSKNVQCSPKKSPRKENMSPSNQTTTRTMNITPSKVAVRLFKNEGECYLKVKKALHTSVPDRLLCREKETSTIVSFLQAHVGEKQPGSLYISGAPGTGKTACVSHIIKQEKELMHGCKVVFLNCMTLKYSFAIFSKLASELGVEITNKKYASKHLEKKLTSKGPMIFMVLDEIDYLDSKNQEVLYTMFEWPSLPNSRAVLLGIANALDLTDRILPRLQARPNCRPQLLNFAPYTKDQIVTILADRLKETDSEEPLVEKAAVQFCARKISAIAGDIRKALDVCRRAVEIVAADVRTQTVLKPTTSVSNSPRKCSSSQAVPKKVGLLHISNVISDVYGSRLSRGSQANTFPLQQKLVVCTLFLIVKQSKIKDVTLGKLHETYSKVCKTRQVPPVDQSEFLSLCHLIETRGVIVLKKAKETRLTKLRLNLEEKEVEFALQDKVLLSSILKAGLPSKKH